MSKKYRVWSCKIVVDGKHDLPMGFDSVPRMAAQRAVENAGFEVITNFSGWDGQLDDNEIKVLIKMLKG